MINRVSAIRNSVWNPAARAGGKADPDVAGSSRGSRSREGSHPRPRKGQREPAPVMTSPEALRPLAPSDRAQWRAPPPRRPAWTADNPADSLLYDDHTCLRAILAGRGRVTRSPEARTT